MYQVYIIIIIDNVNSSLTMVPNNLLFSMIVGDEFVNEKLSW